MLSNESNVPVVAVSQTLFLDTNKVVVLVKDPYVRRH